MLGKFTYFSLGVAAVSAQTYDEINRDGTSDHPTYYNDATSTHRIPGWMKKGTYLANLMDGDLQKSGVWNTQNAATSLGPGSFTTTAYANRPEMTWLNSIVANADHNSLITAVRAYHTGANGDAKSSNGVKGRTPFASPETGSNDPYAHIKNFWHRDGHLFALILDDNANDMIHGGEGLRKQTDIAVSETDGKSSQRIIPMDHHMEHLREFCQYMGGDLWAPSSQEEYDDLMERDGGVCDNHVEVLEGGMPLATGANSKIEIYLNIHRSGYLRCPSTVEFPQKNYQSNNDDKSLYKLGCPSVSKTEYGNTVRDLTSDGSEDDWATFVTTDPWFADDVASATHGGGMCQAPSDDINEYAFWRTKDCHDGGNAGNQDKDKPYIDPDCFTDAADAKPSRHRFQKFVESDQHSLNDVLNNKDSVQQLQKDCVVTTCNNDVGVTTGPADDQRHKSEWNMDNCNLQRHTGICRIRAFGCNTATFACKDNFTRYCGSRSVYVKSITAWADATVDGAATAFTSDITNMLNVNVATKEVMIAAPADNAAITAWIAANEFLKDMGIDVEDGDWASFEKCECECPETTCDSNMAAFTNHKTGGTITTDAARGLSFSGNKQCATDPAFAPHRGWDEASSHTWTCQNDLAGADNNACDCYSGSASSKCVRKTNGFESEWVFQTTIDANVCSDSCCPVYNNNINSAAVMTSTDRKDCMKRGQKYRVCCTGDLHVLGEAEDVTCKDFVVPATGDCFQPLQCKQKTCECQEKENGYCYREGNFADFDVFENDSQLTCRCNEGFVNTGGVDHRPYDTLTCVSGVFDTSKMGKCVPVQCANPHDLLDADNNVIGKALKNAAGNYKSSIGNCLEYECADGYEWSGDSAPRSCCDDIDPNLDGPSGQFGCYSKIIGGCKPIGGCGPPTAVYDNAWGGVVWNAMPLDCHNDDTWMNFDVTHKAYQPSQNQTEYKNGNVAIYECYDDFSAFKEDDFITLTRNIAWETGCANGGSNDPCRLTETDVYVNNWAANKKVRVSHLNDKIVSYCENGEWIAPSHACLCGEEIARRTADWTFTCDMVTATLAPPVTRCDGCETERPEPTSSNKILLTTCGLIPAVFLGMN